MNELYKENQQDSIQINLNSERKIGTLHGVIKYRVVFRLFKPSS